MSHEVLECLPALSNSRRNIWVLNLLVDPRRELTKGALDKLALGEAGSEEDSIDSQQDPGSLAKCQGREKEA